MLWFGSETESKSDDIIDAAAYIAIHCRVIFDESYDEIYEEYADEESWV
ncbi:hypothetical protein [uncultured Campylobacter sp.]|nr:hypothetical protein [uncultured Campylobacter sp.]